MFILLNDINIHEGRKGSVNKIRLGLVSISQSTQFRERMRDAI